MFAVRSETGFNIKEERNMARKKVLFMIGGRQKAEDTEVKDEEALYSAPLLP